MPYPLHGDLVAVAEPVSQLSHERPLDRSDLPPAQSPARITFRLDSQRGVGAQALAFGCARIALQRFEAPREVGDAMRTVADTAHAYAELAAIPQDERDEDGKRDADHEQERRSQASEHRRWQQTHARHRQAPHSVSTGTPIT